MYLQITSNFSLQFASVRVQPDVGGEESLGREVINLFVHLMDSQPRIRIQRFPSTIFFWACYDIFSAHVLRSVNQSNQFHISVRAAAPGVTASLMYCVQVSLTSVKRLCVSRMVSSSSSSSSGSEAKAAKSVVLLDDSSSCR